MRMLLVMAIYIPLTMTALGVALNLVMPKRPDLFPVIYIGWVAICGYGGGWFMYATGVMGWALQVKL
jgi:hypothetical protein